MNKHHLFVLCVQTYVMRTPQTPIDGVQVVAQAGELEPEALGTANAGEAAVEYCRWKLTRGAMPEPNWHKAWREAKENAVVVSVRPGSVEQCGRFWGAVGQYMEEHDPTNHHPAFERDVCRQLVFDTKRETMTREQALLFKDWVESLDGHEEQPFVFEGM
jgi:hypothetical protein